MGASSKKLVHLKVNFAEFLCSILVGMKAERDDVQAEIGGLPLID